MLTVAFLTLGCKVNQFETETMEGLFRERGYAVVPFGERADVYVVNTCSVTGLSEKKSRQLIRRARRQNERAILAVVGCFAQLAPEEVKAIEGVRIVLGTKERSRIVDYVEQAMEEADVLDRVSDIRGEQTFEDIPLFGAPARTRAFLKIEDGCENFCSYCIIPYARGPVRSRSLASIRREAEGLVGKGFLEIVLTGIHLGAYGRDFPEVGGRKPGLADAVGEALVSGLRRLRLGSLESIELSDELLDLMQEDRRVCHHLHIPLQSGSDQVLRGMNRHYDTMEFARLLKRVRGCIPDVAISTDVIVGFPGETEELFAEALAFVEGMGFSRIHVFPYSPRVGTPAAQREDQVPEPVKKDRAHRMHELAERSARAYRSRFLGQRMEVLFETDDGGIKDGLTGNYIRVYTDETVHLGALQEVQIERLYRDGVWASKVSDKFFPADEWK